MAKKVPGQKSGSRNGLAVTERALPGTSRSLLREMVERVLELGPAAAADPEAARAAAARGRGLRTLLAVRSESHEPRPGIPRKTFVTIDVAVATSGATVDEDLPERKSYCGFD